MQTLDEIGLLSGTDKASIHHNYLNFYDVFLSQLRDRPFNFIELGINLGNSIRMWERYFSRATIYGVDIKPQWVDLKFDRAITRLGDCGSPEYLSKLGEELKPLVAIDDASHFWEHQIIAFEALFPHIQDGGVYIVEDIQGSFGPRRKAMGRGYKLDAFSYIMQMQALLVGGGKIGATIRQTTEKQREIAKTIRSINIAYGTAVIVKSND
jgi:hypothetical protein